MIDIMIDSLRILTTLHKQKSTMVLEKRLFYPGFTDLEPSAMMNPIYTFKCDA